ncbi:molybdenum cofactor guanylyltransferase [Sulfuracidifex metallicus]|uniref:molybdenum cofactor guanylyltransferase n=1 Tax=Sulfuracidifex metallicus TaxID=47303 RepID=UPI00210D6ABC|nr:molybdenum cofactor guanylyltransferase [Sulfuracidifex metallicus]WOE51925.1 molybdenum cofactor guanylyltransferase [Sulfuracidifex metallicus DSM 6482 = JCM 9184]
MLAGGKSSRFGCDKCEFKINGATMLDRLNFEFGEPLIVSRHQRGYKREVVEEGRYEGPLKGIKTALNYMKGDKVFLTGCDYPFLTSRLVEHFCDKNFKVVSYYDGRFQPLLSCYSLDYLKQVIGNARKLTDLILMSNEIYLVGYYEVKMLDPYMLSVEDMDSLVSQRRKEEFKVSQILLKESSEILMRS